MTVPTRCQADPSLTRVEVGGFKFPLGVYPVEELTPKAGYTMLFEPADGSGESPEPGAPPPARESPDDEPEDEARESGGLRDAQPEWEEWPDRYLFDAVISNDRLEPLCRQLFSLFKGRVYPILDVLGVDDFREVDPYISYDLIGIDRFMETVRRLRDFFYEDGMCGFGAMTEEPFMYIFVDEHKIVTIRAEPDMKDRIEKILHAFDLEQMEDPAGADSAAHEHRSVLLSPGDRPDLFSPEEIIERLRDEWHLLLNIDPRTNVDDEGRDLGVTCWRCEVRCWGGDEAPPRYAEVILAGGNLEEAEDTAVRGAEELDSGRSEPWSDLVVICADRVRDDRVKDLVKKNVPKSQLREGGRIFSARWLE